ncbi:hypothetical protein TVAG_300600 [Trichomonas vaginalis G3]|uniref:ATPase dynein-related AAA domain-containing protein n=1 Tax=Trichomonas vaginalis (strain ATCC PRA-98 / G3) TaxID=412133 RepID=A2EP40_TRIV3|nr:nuclear chaperone required for maturation and nuclear export of pre-60s ribosome subunits [Trichomonas vaginalis G3]EAY05578.1 hypothetical protein TVAG_300600 [Trichomonas vaginalis G3]KAI5547518.1 nuclear chaperone required for maturation and nuclear export of pre-60s ribosome subunits [Trichomonas vaginalis G3]|eukprot:XP_001317801.1 hypothetical protein [Trichomonas vaginalis G3]
MYSLAFKKGYPLILDEFNLAHEDVLQCIESSLDTEDLYVDDPALNASPIKMHENFKLIATQNDSDSAFASMRNKLTSKLTSHFQIIEFNDFGDDQLTSLCSNFNKNISKDQIKQVIEFHKSCASESNSDYSFTIRNLKTALLSTADPKNLYRSLFYYYQSLLGLDKSNLIADKLKECKIYPNHEEGLDVYQLFKQKQIQTTKKGSMFTNYLSKNKSKMSGRMMF